MDWKTKFEQELKMAADARGRGKEGQARVCARRAAGAVVREYFQRQDLLIRSESAYDLIGDLLSLPGLPAAACEAAEYLILRVTDEFKLPVDVDLVVQARILADCLLPANDGI
jgi:hypothetical protein